MPAASQRPLRIALTTVEYPPDKSSYGLGTYTKSLAHALRDRGHVVHVLARGTSPEDSVETSGTFTLHRLSPARPEVPESINAPKLVRLAASELAREWSYRAKLARKLEELIARHDIDVIEAADATAEGILFPTQRYPHIPFVVRIHGPFAVAELFDRTLPEWARRVVRAIERRLFLKATHVVAPSEAARDLIKSEMGLLTTPTILPHPPSYVRHEGTVESGRDPKLVLYAGRISPCKGIDVLMAAVPIVLAQVPDARFVILGGDAVADHRFETSKRELLARLPKWCQDSVYFAGRQPPEVVAEHYARAGVCVFPSLFDVFGYTCLEAMRHGCAIVGSGNSGMLELLDGGAAGLLYTPPDASDLARQVTRLLSDADLCSELGTRALRRALQEFDEDRVLDLNLAFYHRAIGELRSPGAAHAGVSRRETTRPRDERQRRIGTLPVAGKRDSG